MAMFNFGFRAESQEAKSKQQERERLSAPPSLPIMRVLLEKGYPEDAIGDIKTQGQAERIIELWPKAEKPLPPLMGTRRIEALEERGIEPTLPEIKKGYGMYIEPPEEEKEVPLFSTITGATQMYPESEANRLKMTAPKLYRTFEERAEAPSSYTHKTLYGPGGTTKLVPIPKGKTYIPPPGYSLTKPYQPTLAERDIERKRKATETIQKLDPNEAYRRGWKVNEAGEVELDLVNNIPIKLPPFHKVMGKRGQIKAMKQLGENWDDSKQLMELLKDPKVAKNLKAVEKEIGFWDRVSGKWNNKVRLWMQKRGIAANSPTGTAITRMQRLASQERKEFLGVAVTGTELETTLAWMPNAGDSLSTMLNKTQLMVQEGEETFRRYLDIYKDVANMTPFYTAFGLQRFSKKRLKQPLKQEPRLDEADAYLKSIGQ